MSQLNRWMRSGDDAVTSEFDFPDLGVMFAEGLVMLFQQGLQRLILLFGKIHDGLFRLIQLAIARD